MNSGYLSTPAVFLIDTLFGLYVFALMLRFLLQWMEADFYNPISQFLVKLTHPPLKLLRRFIPSIGRVDTAALLLMFSVQFFAGFLVFLIQGISFNAVMLVVWTLGQLLELFFNIFFFAIIIGALMSWVATGSYSPAAALIFQLTEPLLRIFRRSLPAMGGIDLSPMAALIALQLAKMLILPLLQQFAVVFN